MVVKQRKRRPGRPRGRTHVEAFVVKLPKGTLATWRKAAKGEGLTVAEMVRRAVAERIAVSLARRTKTSVSRVSSKEQS